MEAVPESLLKLLYEQHAKRRTENPAQDHELFLQRKRETPRGGSTFSIREIKRADDCGRAGKKAIKETNSPG